MDLNALKPGVILHITRMNRVDNIIALLTAIKKERNIYTLNYLEISPNLLGLIKSKVLLWLPTEGRFDLGDKNNRVTIMDSLRERGYQYSIDEMDNEPINLFFNQMTGIKISSNRNIYLHYHNFPTVKVPSFLEEYFVGIKPITFHFTQHLFDQWRYALIDTRYICVVKNRERENAKILKFDNLEYLQGIITGFRWDGLNPRDYILHVMDNGELVDIDM